MTNQSLEPQTQAEELYVLASRVQPYQLEFLARRIAMEVLHVNGSRIYRFSDGSALNCNDTGYIGLELAEVDTQLGLAYQRIGTILHELEEE